MEEKTRILFIDDEKDFANAMSQVLVLQGYQVETAYSAKLALQVYSAGKFDLVITDLSMPGMDGIELIRQIRKLHRGQKIIVVTAFPSQRTQEQAYKLGTLSYIAKPFRPARFIEMVKNALTAREEGLLGAVRLSATDLVQLFSFTGKNVVIEIHKGSDDETGRVFFESGQIVHAETSKLKGKKAFYEIQSWGSGIFSSKPLPDKVTRSINESLNALLLQGAHQQDENSSHPQEDTQGSSQS